MDRYDNDGRLDLFVSNYLNWTFETSKFAVPRPTPLVLTTVYKESRIFCITTMVMALHGCLCRDRHSRNIGKGMGVAIADYNADG